MCERCRDVAGIYSGLWQYLCEMSYWYVWHDSFICARDGSCDAVGTYSGVWHDSFIRVTWLIDMCDMSHPCDVATRVQVCDMTFFYECDMTFWYVTWLIDVCEVTDLYVWEIGVEVLHQHVRFPCHTFAFICHTYAFMCHTYAFMCHTYAFICVTQLAHMNAYVWHGAVMLHEHVRFSYSYVWHDSFVWVQWLICTCDMTRSYMWHDSFICVTWLIHMSDTTHSYVW